MKKLSSCLKVFLVGILFSQQQFGYSQYSEEALIEKIESFQIKQHEFYDAGLFPVERTWSFSSKPVADNTIFFTASIISTLRMVYADLNDESQQKVDLIISNAELLYPKYKSRNGEITYNFWQTIEPDLPFPNGSKLISNERLRLPDDFDTSVLIALAKEENGSTDKLLRERMTNYSSRQNRADVKLYTLKKYEDYLAYETWFGKDMPQTFDVCVMSNVLLYVTRKQFELNAYDSASISLIREMIQNNDHMERTVDVSHHSNSPALVLYHVARLIASDSSKVLDDIRDKVVTDLISINEETENEIEKIMIATSLLKLGQKTDYKIDIDRFESDAKTFSFLR